MDGERITLHTPLPAPSYSWLKEATPAIVMRRLRLKWDEPRGIVERAVATWARAVLSDTDRENWGE